MDKKGLEFSFAWLFSIIVGAFILFLAIFLAGKIIQTGQEEIDAKTGKEFGILLNPLETGFESLKSNQITMPVDSRIYIGCDNEGEFGRQLIKVSQKSFNRWTDTNINVGFSNKYIFSDNYVEGKKFYLFSKPLEFPFKVADLIVLTPAETTYCFEDPPENIGEELIGINQDNFFVGNCSQRKADVYVCFSGKSCDVNINYANGIVKKGDEVSYFEDDALMYAAIFSNKGLYECQVNRLMKRIKDLSLIYVDKAGIVSLRGCNSNLNSELIVLASLAEKFKNSDELTQMAELVKNLKDENEVAMCKLW
jgi:hypothetical protein